MVLTLYKMESSPPARSARMIIDLLGLDANCVDVDVMAGEHLSPEFIKKNPLHTVPTLEDDGFFIGDSNAISAYLVDKYAKDDSLYPRDLQKRALVDQRLYFNCGTLFVTLRNIGADIIWIPKGDGRLTDRHKEDTLNVYGLLEALIKHAGGPWLAGDQLTIADICNVSSASSLNAIIPIEADNFPRTYAWLQKCSKLPAFQKYNVPGNEKLAAIFRSKMKD